MDEYEAQRERSIQALRGGAKGEDWWRDSGNMLSPANSIRLLNFIHSVMMQDSETQQRTFAPGYPGWRFYTQDPDGQRGTQNR